MNVNDVVKIRFTREGYLPNYPPHLISDNEMCDAFLKYGEDSEDNWNAFKSSIDASYFKDNYPLIDSTLESEYRTLVSNIAYHLNNYKSSTDDNRKLPDWIYSYMLGCVISVNSSQLDIHDMLVSMDTDNIDDIYTKEAAAACYKYSQAWLGRLPSSNLDHRPPTMFGEPHVIKYLRLLDVGTFTGAM